MGWAWLCHDWVSGSARGLFFFSLFRLLLNVKPLLFLCGGEFEVTRWRLSELLDDRTTFSWGLCRTDSEQEALIGRSASSNPNHSPELFDQLVNWKGFWSSFASPQKCLLWWRGWQSGNECKINGSLVSSQDFTLVLDEIWLDAERQMMLTSQ